jgi:hypothetical protein
MQSDPRLTFVTGGYRAVGLPKANGQSASSMSHLWNKLPANRPGRCGWSGRHVSMPVPVPRMRVRTLSPSVWGGLQPKVPDKHDRMHNDICQPETQKLER